MTQYTNSMGLEEAKIVAKFQRNDIEIQYGFNLSIIHYFTLFTSWVNGLIFAVLCFVMIFDSKFASKYYNLFIAFTAFMIFVIIAEAIAKAKMNKEYTAILYNSTKNIVNDIEEYQRLDDSQKVEFFNTHFSDIIGMEETKQYKEV